MVVWLMNRARQNPSVEGEWLAMSPEPDVANRISEYNVDVEALKTYFSGYPVMPPAAFDVRLYNAAYTHSLDMITRNSLDHNGQLEAVDASGFRRCQTACMRGGNYGGSIISAENALDAHAGWQIDWNSSGSGGGHRDDLMSIEGYLTNVGVAMVPDSNPSTSVGPLATSSNYFQAQANGVDHFNRFITGTAWTDLNGNGRYDPNEGHGGVMVMPDKGTYYAITGVSGGYAIPIVNPDVYSLTFSGGGIPIATRQATVDNDSVLLDYKVGPDCTYTLTPKDQSFGYLGGTGIINIATSSDECYWGSSSLVPWITLTTSNNGIGNGSVGYSVASSTSLDPRIGQVMAAGRTFMVNQEASPNLPDLIISEITASSNSTTTGETISFSTKARNPGPASASTYRIQFYLSTDPEITTSDIDTGKGCNKTSGLSGGGSSYNTCEGSWQIPASTPSGTYYIGAYADSNQQVTEINEVNNGLAAANTITITGIITPTTTLITHYYASILRRNPDVDGLAYWQQLIAQKQAQGLDVKSVFRDMANFFFNSTEYLDRNTLTNLYLTFFQREPDEGGLAFWLDQLASGMVRNNAMAGFLYSPEFTDFMESLGF